MTLDASSVVVHHPCGHQARGGCCGTGVNGGSNLNCEMLDNKAPLTVSWALPGTLATCYVDRSSVRVTWGGF